MATICITGRVGSDGELRKMQDGTSVLGFSIADEVGWGDRKQTNWVKCALFGKRAESVAQYVTKGSIVEVTGVPTVEAWLSKKDNAPAAAIKVRVSELRLHGGSKSDRPVADSARATAADDSDIPW